MDWRVIIIIILLVLTVIGAVGSTIGFIRAGADAKRTVDLENTIGRLSANYQFVKDINSRIKQDYSGLQDNNRRLEEAVGRLESGVAGAADFIRSAIETSGRLERLSERIAN